MPFFSIIIPTFNSAATLSDALQSIINQSFTDFEILIMDGVSKDNTLEIAKSFNDDRIKIFSEPDKGVYDAMNKGIDKATGKWLYFLGSDDTFYEIGVLDKIFNTIKNNPEINFLYGNAYFTSSKVIYDGLFDFRKILDQNICHQSIFYKKILFDSLGYYNLKYKIWSDHEFNIKCFCFSEFRPLFINEIICNYNDGSGLSQDDDENLKPFIDMLIPIIDTHRNFVLQNSIDYRIGFKILQPLRIIKRFFSL